MRKRVGSSGRDCFLDHSEILDWLHRLRGTVRVTYEA